MATTFKPLTANDITNTRTLLHEAIPITGTIFSGTYGGNTIALGSATNIKNYAHGIFESVYDYPYLSSSANHILDLTVGYSTGSAISASTNLQNDKKVNIYNEMATVLMGHDISGNILRFDEDGNISEGGTKLNECVFMNFARLLTKDEIKKGSFSFEIGASASFDASGSGTPFEPRILVQDTNAQSNYFVNSPTGEYGILKVVSGSDLGGSLMNGHPVGLLFYQAGVAVLSGSLFGTSSAVRSTAGTGFGTLSASMAMTGTNSFQSFLTGASIQNACDAIRHRIYNLSFNNTTELNSTIYFCRASHNDFNYSSNPSYLSSSQIVVKNSTSDQPLSYITTVGLYSDDNQLLAVAKVSEPLRKDPNTELTLRVRLDY